MHGSSPLVYITPKNSVSLGGFWNERVVMAISLIKIIVIILKNYHVSQENQSSKQSIARNHAFHRKELIIWLIVQLWWWRRVRWWWCWCCYRCCYCCWWYWQRWSDCIPQFRTLRARVVATFLGPCSAHLTAPVHIYTLSKSWCIMTEAMCQWVRLDCVVGCVM